MGRSLCGGGGGGGVLIVNQGGKTQPTMGSGFPRLCPELCKSKESTPV